MTPSQKRRLYMVLGILVGVGVATTFGLQAFRSSIGFKAPVDVAGGAIQVADPVEVSFEIRATAR